MKIYVSDKYNETLKNKTIIHTPRGCGKEFENYLKIVKEFKKNNQNFMLVFSERSLEQHEAEIRKPLEDEIEKLKEELSFEDRAYNALSKVNDNNIKLAKKNEDAYFTMRDLKYQERKRVIAELQKFENEQRLRARKISKEYPTDNEEQKARLYALSSGRFDILENLKQKLNEMKEV